MTRTWLAFLSFLCLIITGCVATGSTLPPAPSATPALAEVSPTPLATLTPQIQDGQAGVPIGGVISGTLSQRVYQVTEDLIVPVDQTLVIEEGIYLSFAPGTRLVVAGQLIAGERLPIHFLSQDPESGWGGLHFLPSSHDSRCFRCYLEYIEPGGVAVTAEAPLVLQEGKITVVQGGTAISTTVPITLSNTAIDYVDTALYVSGAPVAPWKATHLALSRCRRGIVNRGQDFSLDNSIISACKYPITTELSGTTAISYSLLHGYVENVTEPGAQLNQGPGMLDRVDPGFIGTPDSPVLRRDSLAVNAADPSADYSREPGYNGGRADMGAYGNTERARQRPPLDQMGVAISTSTPSRVVQPGETVTFTVRVTNTGTVTDVYHIAIDEYRNDLHRYASMTEWGYVGPEIVRLAPHAVITQTIWVELPADIQTRSDISNTIHISTFNGFGIGDWLDLEVLVPSFHESDGAVAIEAENYNRQTDDAGHAWLTQSIISGYVASSYVNAMPDNDLQFTASFTEASPSLHYVISFTTMGTYTVWLRGYAPNAAGDSLYIGLDDQPPALLTGFAHRRWTWANRNSQADPVVIEVMEPGLHMLHVWQREDGLRLDRILMSTESGYIPLGDGPPESEFR
jgi:hypothetical protein